MKLLNGGKIAISVLAFALAGSAALAQPMPAMEQGPQGQPGIPFSGVAPVAENQAVLEERPV